MRAQVPKRVCGVGGGRTGGSSGEELNKHDLRVNRNGHQEHLLKKIHILYSRIAHRIKWEKGGM